MICQSAGILIFTFSLKLVMYNPDEHLPQVTETFFPLLFIFPTLLADFIEIYNPDDYLPQVIETFVCLQIAFYSFVGTQLCLYFLRY